MNNYYLESKEKSKTITRIVVVSIVIIITILIVHKVNKNNKENFYETEAVVTDIVMGFKGEDKDDFYHVQYQYEVEGKTYEGGYQEKVVFLLPKKEDKIKIRYSKEDESKSKPNLFSRYVKHVVSIVIALLIGVILFIIRKNNR